MTQYCANYCVQTLRDFTRFKYRSVQFHKMSNFSPSKSLRRYPSWFKLININVKCPSVFIRLWRLRETFGEILCRKPEHFWSSFTSHGKVRVPYSATQPAVFTEDALKLHNVVQFKFAQLIQGADKFFLLLLE